MPLAQLLSAIRQLDELDLEIEHLRQPPMVLDDTIGFASLLRGLASFIYPTEQRQEYGLAGDTVGI